ncbi:uncharacterized protein LOC100844661 [Brachypodium distachyon]|uniref:Uncharacterized protein n=1 Tax=Brachypodium distachyon TaxID=15368 RepID=I1HD38_BRADI|nr:uncharacterized protein LOC100844661 [Brachypodium distachyon]KQK03222.1 hypothetical protein BRADI_2g06410v3 [Brachypodium distachyon]|eukprot:XP_003565476.1 uncharacterized protein LOC100844661 [Brachypodium distachyon]
MAFSATRRLSAAAAPAAKLSSLFPHRRTPKPRLPATESGGEPWRRKPTSRPRQPWGEDAVALLRRLHEGRYLPGPDLSEAPHVLSPDIVKAAAERFGHDHQVVAKWLSGSDLKKLALFGCPSVERRTVFASKRLRSFFNIPEDKICSSCKIRSSCQFVNQEVPRHHKVILSDTMRILTLFVLDACPQQLQVTAELKASVCKLLKDTMNLSSIFDKPIV